MNISQVAGIHEALGQWSDGADHDTDGDRACTQVSWNWAGWSGSQDPTGEVLPWEQEDGQVAHFQLGD